MDTLVSRRAHVRSSLPMRTLLPEPELAQISALAFSRLASKGEYGSRCRYGVCHKVSGSRCIPLHGLSRGTTSGAGSLSRSISRRSLEARPGNVPKKMRRFESVSASAFAPFLLAITCNSCWRQLASWRSACSYSFEVVAGLDVRYVMENETCVVLQEPDMRRSWISSSSRAWTAAPTSTL